MVVLGKQRSREIPEREGSVCENKTNRADVLPEGSGQAREVVQWLCCDVLRAVVDACVDGVKRRRTLVKNRGQSSFYRQWARAPEQTERERKTTRDVPSSSVCPDVQESLSTRAAILRREGAGGGYTLFTEQSSAQLHRHNHKHTYQTDKAAFQRRETAVTLVKGLSFCLRQVSSLSRPFCFVSGAWKSSARMAAQLRLPFIPPSLFLSVWPLVRALYRAHQSSQTKALKEACSLCQAGRICQENGCRLVTRRATH